MTDPPPTDARIAAGTRRRWRTLLAVIGVAGSVGLLAIVGRSTLTESVSTFGRLDWTWIPLAVAAEAASMAAFARAQRRLLRAGGADVHLRSMMAVTYAGNAISVSLPLAGSEVATAFTFRQFSRRGIDPSVAGWALAVSGLFSSVGFAVVLAGGAVATGNVTVALLGVVAAILSMLPTVAVLGALRYQSVRRLLNRILDRLIAASRRLVHRPGPDAEQLLERFLDRITSLHLPRLQAVEIFGLAVWNWVADCFCLAAAIRATDTPVPWQGLFLAYAAGMTAASIGLTPGGLGIIEASLAAALVAAGIRGHHALAAVLIYRVISFWLVMAAGWAVMAFLTREARRETTPVLDVDAPSALNL